MHQNPLEVVQLRCTPNTPKSHPKHIKWLILDNLCYAQSALSMYSFGIGLSAPNFKKEMFTIVEVAYGVKTVIFGGSGGILATLPGEWQPLFKASI